MEQYDFSLHLPTRPMVSPVFSPIFIDILLFTLIWDMCSTQFSLISIRLSVSTIDTGSDLQRKRQVAHVIALKWWAHASPVKQSGLFVGCQASYIHHNHVQRSWHILCPANPLIKATVYVHAFIFGLCPSNLVLLFSLLIVFTIFYVTFLLAESEFPYSGWSSGFAKKRANVSCFLCFRNGDANATQLVSWFRCQAGHSEL